MTTDSNEALDKATKPPPELPTDGVSISLAGLTGHGMSLRGLSIQIGWKVAVVAVIVVVIGGAVVRHFTGG